MVLPARDIAAMIGIESTDSTLISTLLTDSRNLTFPDETLFFAIRTQVNDGHKFVHELYEKGVRHFVVDIDAVLPALPGAEVWRVPRVLDALQEIAAKVRALCPDLPVIGITGSRGKTVVKELLYKLLRGQFDITRSPRSYNSQIGVPLSIWKLQPSTTLGIFEAGISQPGEMRRLEAMIRPTVGVFVSLTSEHDDGFADLGQKAREKALLFASCTDVFYSASDPKIAEALQGLKARLHPVAGNCEALALATAEFVAGRKLDSIAIAGLSHKISARIDVTETLKNCIVVYDGFASSLDSLAEALNYAQRHAAGRKLALIADSAIDYGQPQLQRLLEAKGVGRLIATPSAQDFMREYSISDFNDEAILISGSPESDFDDIKTYLEAPRHETIMEVDLGAIVRNFNYYRSLLKPSAGLIAMVKAEGYGIGALELSKTLQNQGAAYLAVAVVDEGTELRRGGITMPIIVMNPITTNYKALFENKLEPSVFSLRELRQLIDSAESLGLEGYPVHIKLDTGMHRVGFLRDELPALLEMLRSQKAVRVSTIFSHLATADCLDQDAYTEGQLQAFEEMSAQIIDGLPYEVKRHVLNTAGMMRYPESQYDFARLGIGLYGISPLPTGNVNLAPVARLLTRIISIKHWEPGATIGYGRRGVIDKPSIIATIPIGYADGLDRHLSCGAAKFIVNGVECPTVGNICMDQCMIDVTEANASIGDEVEIFGPAAPLQRLSDTLGTIPYEILTSVSPRVKRIYFRE